MLEAGLNADNAFLTLTYEKDPVSLEPLDHRRFMDALRKRLAPLKIRFYMVGEYGEKNDRPHFHYIIFGYPSCRSNSSNRLDCRCVACRPIAEVWGKGLIKNLPVEIGSCRYVARYVVKKMTRFDDPRLKSNMHPEFSRMSLKPGIGYGALKRVAHVISRYDLLTPEGDVPVTLRHGTTQWPLGRYLRKKLRKELGLNEQAPSVLSAMGAFRAFNSAENQEMRALQKTAIANQTSLKEELLKASEGRRAQIKRRLDIFLSKKGRL